jgi:hypothetical protein
MYTLDKDEKPQPGQEQEIANAAPRIWKPQADDIVVDAVRTDSPAPGRTDATVKPVDTTAVRPMDTAVVRRQTVITDTPLTTTATSTLPATVAAPPPPPPAPLVDPAKEDSKTIAESFAKRKEVVTKILDVESDSVRLSFYDNGDIDGDSISVFVNSHIVLSHQELTAKALTIYLHLDSTRDINEIGMFAENLGKYPPNTALMVITDGKNRYEIFMSSSLTENATIQIRKKKSPR